MNLTISSDLQLQETLTSFQNEVVCFLCENTDDIHHLDEMLTNLEISHDVYCPFPPYQQKGDVFIDFVKKVEKERRGK